MQARRRGDFKLPKLEIKVLSWGETGKYFNTSELVELNLCIHTLTGTTSINYMIYTRGNKEDYDMYAENGNTGWSHDEVLPYFLKSENNRIAELQNTSYHAQGGPLNVESIPFRTLLADAFIEAGKELGK